MICDQDGRRVIYVDGVPHRVLSSRVSTVYVDPGPVDQGDPLRPALESFAAWPRRRAGRTLPPLRYGDGFYCVAGVGSWLRLRRCRGWLRRHDRGDFYPLMSDGIRRSW